jgi:hypothetical protein
LGSVLIAASSHTYVAGLADKVTRQAPVQQPIPVFLQHRVGGLEPLQSEAASSPSQPRSRSSGASGRRHRRRRSRRGGGGHYSLTPASRMPSKMGSGWAIVPTKLVSTILPAPSFFASTFAEPSIAALFGFSRRVAWRGASPKARPACIRPRPASGTPLWREFWRRP